MLKLISKQNKCQTNKTDKINSYQKADKVDKTNKDHKLDVEAHKVDSN